MTENGEQPELLLAGADRPRPLPPALRARLEDALAGMAAGTEDAGTEDAGTEDAGTEDAGTEEEEARPLSPEVRGRLEESLAPLPGRRDQRKWRAISIASGAAAAIVVLAAVLGPGLVHRPGANTFAANGAVREPAVRHSTGTPAGWKGVRTYTVVPKAPAVVNGPTSAKAPHDGPIAPTPAEAPRGRRGRSPKPALPPSAGGPAAKGTPVLAPAAKSTTSGSTTSGTKLGVLGSVRPARGLAAGGNWVMVTGVGLGRVTSVYFGATKASRFRLVSSTEIRVLAPAHAAGTVEIRLRLSGGTVVHAPLAGRYTYVRRM